MTGARVAVCAYPPHHVPLQNEAAELAERLGLPKTRFGDPEGDLLLIVAGHRLELRVVGEDELAGCTPVYVDLLAIDTTSPAGRKLNTPLLKAVGVKKGQPYRPRVIDCTAGFGEDAWLLKAQGCEVTGLERNPIVAELLKDGLNRASHVDAFSAFDLQQADASIWLSIENQQEPLKDRFDALVMDPMFPSGRKTKERKQMRVLRMLAGDDDDAPDLLAAALATGIHRVCVKRPLKALAIASEKRPAPDVVYKGKAVRFDVYLNH